MSETAGQLAAVLGAITAAPGSTADQVWLTVAAVDTPGEARRVLYLLAGQGRVRKDPDPHGERWYPVQLVHHD